MLCVSFWAPVEKALGTREILVRISVCQAYQYINTSHCSIWNVQVHFFPPTLPCFRITWRVCLKNKNKNAVVSHYHSLWLRRSGMGPKIYISHNFQELWRLLVWGPLWDSFLQFICLSHYKELIFKKKKIELTECPQDLVYDKVLLISDILQHLGYWKGTGTPPR